MFHNNGGMTYSSYDLNTYVYPYWHGNTVYNETALFVGITPRLQAFYRYGVVFGGNRYFIRIANIDFRYGGNGFCAFRMRRALTKKREFFAQCGSA